MNPEEKNNFIKAWFEKADHDLQSAYRLIDIAPPILDTACFHCQQSVEKDLKAFLIYHDVDIERTHSINHLLNKCALIDPVFEKIEIRNISVFAVSIRYPDLAEIPDLSEAKFYYELATNVKGIVRNRIDLSLTFTKKISAQKLLLPKKKKTNGLLEKNNKNRNPIRKKR
jgi:HEPN domain-containing protein